MPKATNVSATRKRHQRLLKESRGYFGNRSRLYRYAIDAVSKAGVYAYRDRRKRKSEFRKLWIVRINAACRAAGMTYSRFMCGLKAAGIEMNRKSLSELAVHDPEAFGLLIEKVKATLPSAG